MRGTMKQTAVEWMANEFLYLDNEFYMKLIDKNEYQVRRKQITEQAKEMEKEQIEIAFFQGDLFAVDYFDADKPNQDCSENYYNKTFKSE
jgi:hypothetical protein